MEERLQKFWRRPVLLPIREAEKIITAGRVRVQQRLIKELGDKFDLSSICITVDGNPILCRS